MIEPGTEEAADALLALCRARHLTLATAESCTGGLAAAVLTAVAGSSDVVDRGYVTYSNRAKTAMLGVPEPMLARHGAVSEPVARAMAQGARERSGASLAVAITGIAGPGGGGSDKPVGLVHFAAASGAGTIHVERRYGPIGRTAVRAASVTQALALLRELAEQA